LSPSWKAELDIDNLIFLPPEEILAMIPNLKASSIQ